MLGPDYKKLALRDLVERIGHQDDREALWELHQRLLAELADGRRVTLCGWMAVLREWAHGTGRWRNAGTEVVDNACDLLLDRFQNWPTEPANTSEHAEEDDQEVEPKGPDCRNYFRAFLHCLGEDFERYPPATELEAEVRTAGLLQRFVRRHLYYCFRESLRERNPLISRYAWRVNGYVFVLWLPKSIGGSHRSEWLERHVPNLGELRPWDRDKIQTVIDEHFGVLRVTSLDDKNHWANIAGHPAPGPTDPADGLAGQSARERIAAEKARTIDRQMPAIRVLGPERLEALVLAVLDNLVTERETDREIARRFGLSPATFSRFAGRGGRGEKARKRLPALFLNIAHFLAEIPELAVLAGAERVFAKTRQTAAQDDLPERSTATDAP